MKRNILVIDDDSVLQDLLRDYFHDHLFVTTSALTGRDGIEILGNVLGTSCDLVVLDIMLPDLDGFETLRQIRTLSKVPVIMLTARSDETDRIIGLEMGADDYMHKPFNPRELLARIKAVLRRTTTPLTGPTAVPSDERFHAGPFIIDPVTCKLFRDGNEIPLSGVEFDIIRELALFPGRARSRDHLLNIARGRDFEAFDRSIDVHISRIRKKIERHPARPEYIKTVWGKGYAWGDDTPDTL
ncbi:MAG: response regulator [Proteobacteria bacterium]|nr:response regulator [Pseudomonadota bacterium]